MKQIPLYALALLVLLTGCAGIAPQHAPEYFDIAVPLPVHETLRMSGMLRIEHFQAQNGGSCHAPEARILARAAYDNERHLAAMPGAQIASTSASLPCRLASVQVKPNLIVTAGKNYLVAAWQNSVELENLKFHGVGTGTNAAAAGDTALQTESTTIINPDSTRATGSLTEGASANIFRTVGTVSFDGSGAITEWGLFSQAATGGGTLWSRVVFSAINVANGDSIQFTYDVTVS